MALAGYRVGWSQPEEAIVKKLALHKVCDHRSAMAVVGAQAFHDDALARGAEAEATVAVSSHFGGGTGGEPFGGMSGAHFGGAMGGEHLGRIGEEHFGGEAAHQHFEEHQRLGKSGTADSMVNSDSCWSPEQIRPRRFARSLLKQSPAPGRSFPGEPSSRQHFGRITALSGRWHSAIGPCFTLLDEQFLMEAAWEAGGPPAASLPIVWIQGCTKHAGDP